MEVLETKRNFREVPTKNESRNRRKGSVKVLEVPFSSTTCDLSEETREEKGPSKRDVRDRRKQWDFRLKAFLDGYGVDERRTREQERQRLLTRLRGALLSPRDRGLRK